MCIRDSLGGGSPSEKRTGGPAPGRGNGRHSAAGGTSSPREEHDEQGVGRDPGERRRGAGDRVADRRRVAATARIVRREALRGQGRSMTGKRLVAILASVAVALVIALPASAGS